MAAEAHSHRGTHPIVPELREGVNDDTKHNVQSNGGDNDEEGHIEQQAQAHHLILLWGQGDYLRG